MSGPIVRRVCREPECGRPVYAPNALRCGACREARNAERNRIRSLAYHHRRASKARCRRCRETFQRVPLSRYQLCPKCRQTSAAVVIEAAGLDVAPAVVEAVRRPRAGSQDLPAAVIDAIFRRELAAIRAKRAAALRAGDDGLAD